MKQIFILTLVFVVAIVCIIASIPRPFSFVNAPRASAAAPWLTLRDDGPMPDLGGAVAGLNSPPLDGQSLRGNVVLVDIWTYSCINSLRQFPYVRKGLEI